jgi:hypothetical protein
VRMRILLGLATCVAAAASAVAVAMPAQSARLPCNLGGSGNSASATCYGGYSYTWRLVVDCLDTSNLRWPVVVTTLYGNYRTGDGTDTLTCASSLRASGRLEAR